MIESNALHRLNYIESNTESEAPQVECPTYPFQPTCSFFSTSEPALMPPIGSGSSFEKEASGLSIACNLHVFADAAFPAARLVPGTLPRRDLRSLRSLRRSKGRRRRGAGGGGTEGEEEGFEALSREGCCQLPLCEGYRPCFGTWRRIRYFEGLSILRTGGRRVCNRRGSKVLAKPRARDLEAL